ncbi:Maltodextrin phosphorylase [Serratia plymuthica]|uniref:Alpha-1,4 glucan phosphorylase n=1 Tax=Serratia plymuthica TaxID=82996 RepID=A0A2X4V517_SERPL|nr:Maltodextrin phosphorylase [Serratia plymuthica]
MSATVQDILNRHWTMHKTFDNLADKIAIHLNDTHPVLSIPELMHRLIDDHKFSWLDAWAVVERVFSYTNHTLMSEALETWPLDMIGRILPRHLQLIFEINDHFLKHVQEVVRATTSCWRGCRSLTRPMAAGYAWHGWRWWPAIRSTGFPHCIPS